MQSQSTADLNVGVMGSSPLQTAPDDSSSTGGAKDEEDEDEEDDGGDEKMEGHDPEKLKAFNVSIQPKQNERAQIMQFVLLAKSGQVVPHVHREASHVLEHDLGLSKGLHNSRDDGFADI